MLHYLAHVEQNPDAVERLLAFIHENDAGHDSLSFFRPNEGEATESANAE